MSDVRLKINLLCKIPSADLNSNDIMSIKEYKINLFLYIEHVLSNHCSFVLSGFKTFD